MESMKSFQPNYRIYPSLLDKFNYFLAPTQYLSEEDDAPTEEDIKAKQFEELINAINRVPHETSEAQARGIALESCLNALLDGEKVDTKVDKKGNNFWVYDGFEFTEYVITRLLEELKGCSTRNERITALVETPMGLVELYGVRDYSFPLVSIDLKSTKKYELFKYQKNTQHKVYPLIDITNGIPVDNFAYLVTDFKEVYAEQYTWSDKFKAELIENLCDFIGFLENNRHLITDKKIFGAENDAPSPPTAPVQEYQTTLF